MDADTKAAIIAEIDAQIAEEQRTPDEFDHGEFAEQTGRTRRASEIILCKLLAAGELTRRKVLDDGHLRWVYKKV